MAPHSAPQRAPQRAPQFRQRGRALHAYKAMWHARSRLVSNCTALRAYKAKACGMRDLVWSLTVRCVISSDLET